MSTVQEADLPVVSIVGDIKCAGELWSHGMDTFDIARELGVSEAHALWGVGRYRDVMRERRRHAH